MGCSSSNTKENSSKPKQESDTKKRDDKKIIKQGGSSKTNSKYNLNYYLPEASIYKVTNANEYYSILGNNENVLVFCCKNDCPNCNMMEPVVFEKSLDHNRNLKVIKIKCEDLPDLISIDVDTEQNLLLPYIKLYQNNQFVKMVNGDNDVQFEEMICSLNLDKDPVVLRVENGDQLNEIKSSAAQNNRVLIITAGQKYCPTCDYMLSRMLKIKSLYKDEFVIVKLDSSKQADLCYDGIDYVKYPVDGIPIIRVYDRTGEMVGHVYGTKTREFDLLVNKAYGKDIFLVPENNVNKIAFNNPDIPNRVVISSSDEYQSCQNGTYLHYPMSFNHFIYKHETSDLAMYWYESTDKTLGFWRFSILEELQFTADEFSDRLGYGSFYGKYNCSIEDKFTDQKESQYDKFNINFYWDHLPGGRKKQPGDKIELQDSSGFPKEVEIEFTGEDMWDSIKSACGVYSHHPIELNHDVYLHSNQEVCLYWYVDGDSGFWRTCGKKSLNVCAIPNGSNFGGGSHYIKYGCSLDQKYSNFNGEWNISFKF